MAVSVLTTGDVAEYCHVTSVTVLNWINAGQLKAYQTPGGHSRITIGDFRDFLKCHGMPIRTDFFPEEKKKILIVDDEPEVASLVLKILKRQFPSFEFAIAFNGYEAGFQAATLRPDLITLDVRMPGIDGAETCRRIKTSPETMSARILAITAFPEDEGLKQMMAYGTDDYLVKPFSADDLMSKVLPLLSTLSA